MRTITTLCLTLGSLLLAATPAAASPFGSDSFRDAKSGYRVDVSHDGATMLLDGYNPHSHDHFHLSVTPRGLVTGVFQGRKINYVVGQSAPDELVAVNTAR